MTDVALEWAEKKVKNNPHISELTEIRKVESSESTLSIQESHNCKSAQDESNMDMSGHVDEEAEPSSSSSFNLLAGANRSYNGPPVLLAVVRDGEQFDFCMCNPPFFESMEEAGLNPKTSCGGTPEEMVCSGGERAFITHIIEDSVALKQTFRWYTLMIGQKSNLKFLISKLQKVGTTIVKTTVFVQGQTCRWGLAWSFVPHARKIISPHVAEKKNLSFILEITASNDHCNTILKNEVNHIDEGPTNKHLEETSNSSSCFNAPSTSLSFHTTVFQQIPGTLLVQGSLQHKDNPLPGLFSSIFRQLEENLRRKFCR